MNKLIAILHSTILKYGASSVISFLVDYGIFALLYYGLPLLGGLFSDGPFSGALFSGGVSILTATYVARACSCVVNFILNRNGVFASNGNIAGQFIQYIALVAISATISGLAVTFLTARLPFPAIVIKFCVEAVLFFLNYLVQKKLIFRQH